MTVLPVSAVPLASLGLRKAPGKVIPIMGVPVEAWVFDGLCEDMNDTFFSPRGSDWSAAKRVCGDCPVRRECLEYALETRQVNGVWGGASQVQLRFALSLRPDGTAHRYRGELQCPWCYKTDVELTAPERGSGDPEDADCRACGFHWTRVYVVRRSRKKV